MSFKLGQEVVCVNAMLPGFGHNFKSPVVPGDIVKIKEIENDNNRIWLTFHQTANDLQFDAYDFRPVKGVSSQSEVFADITLHKIREQHEYWESGHLYDAYLYITYGKEKEF